MEEKRFEFTIALVGYGFTPDEAWQDAVEGFMYEPGATPENYDVED